MQLLTVVELRGARGGLAPPKAEAAPLKHPISEGPGGPLNGPPEVPQNIDIILPSSKYSALVIIWYISLPDDH